MVGGFNNSRIKKSLISEYKTINKKKESIISCIILDIEIDTSNTQARAINRRRVLVENVATRRGFHQCISHHCKAAINSSFFIEP